MPVPGVRLSAGAGRGGSGLVCCGPAAAPPRARLRLRLRLSRGGGLARSGEGELGVCLICRGLCWGPCTPRPPRNRRLSPQVAVRACFLGFAFGCGLLLSFGGASWQHFGWYLCSLSFFHYSEYLVTAIINPQSLSLDSFLLNHSLEYKLAAMSSWVEFTIEKLFFPELKQLRWLSCLGLAMVLVGETLRKVAMLTAGSNFNHIVQNEKSESHQLVTSGVYAWFRHPSYVGWFYWSIGTQVILCNPICIVGYTLASWRFFRERIEEEEVTLIHFFGEDYLLYKKQVSTGLPFIQGVKVEP
uniref:Protein-S-isoprenylcysteine O-methyltransferase n=1 Tax=Callorhinchus milii TaxID=7868 RepID=A0A4W3HJ86_CALMI